jgi:hypothetical protein
VTYGPTHVEPKNRRVPVEEDPILIPVMSQSYQAVIDVNSEHNVSQVKLVHYDFI